ncbi:hypothetical protein FQN54_005168 [Arachnomyces sp. PD_36]|nr:hypothetical protein FQN54_005168 [Arachnomyces sp. PD_36]
MSYPPQQPNYYGGPPPPQGHSPQPGYGYAPPPGQYAPPQGQYPPPQQYYPGYGAPPPQGHYPSPGQYGQPPPQGHYPPPGGHYGAPPPHGYPTQQAPQHPQQYHQGPYQTGYGAPPPAQYHPQQYSAPPGPPSVPSPGYEPGQVAPGDASRDADALKRAINNSDHKALIKILAQPDPLQLELLKRAYSQRTKGDLEKDVGSVSSKTRHYGQGLRAVVRGPLMNDVEYLKKAVEGMGTNEVILNDVLLNRSNADIEAIKKAYGDEYSTTLESDVSGDLSFLTKELFKMVMAGRRASEATPIDQQAMLKDATDLKIATDKPRSDVDQMTVMTILTSRSDGQLRAINQAYNSRFQTPFKTVIKDKFRGHMRDAFLTIWGRALDRAKYDAKALERCMKGAGTNDDLLVQRIVRLHWNRQHLAQVKEAYKSNPKLPKNLSDRVRGEIGILSMDYRRLMLALLE